MARKFGKPISRYTDLLINRPCCFRCFTLHSLHTCLARVPPFSLKRFPDHIVDHHSCVGLTDASGKLVGNLSVTDLRGLSTPESFAKLVAPAVDFVQATARPLVTLTPASTFAQLLETLVNNKLRRVYIFATEDGKEVVDGIVSITDILRLVANPAIEEEGGEKDEDEEMDGDDDEEEVEESA